MSNTLTLALVTNDDNPETGRRDKASLNLNSNNTWNKAEAGSTSNMFRTTSGKWIAVIPNIVELQKPNGSGKVGRIRNLIVGTAGPDARGDGMSDETGRLFKWSVI